MAQEKKAGNCLSNSNLIAPGPRNIRLGEKKKLVENAAA